MVSDFINECNGYLALTKEEYNHAKVTDPTICLQARVEYGESKDGYWKFTKQMEMAVRIAEVKYPKSDGWRRVDI